MFFASFLTTKDEWNDDDENNSYLTHFLSFEYQTDIYITTAVRQSNIRNFCLFILDYMLLNENERNNDLWENEEEWQTMSWEAIHE